jgi:hypothetical protein
MRVLVALAIALVLVPIAAATRTPKPWLAQAMCVHRHEGPWSANTGNGYFGGMQFAAETWLRAKGAPQAAFKHPGDPAFPFAATKAEQLRVAYRIWLADGRTWKSWNAVGAACAR